LAEAGRIAAEGQAMTPINGPLAIDQCNCFAIRKAARQITRFYDAHLQPIGLRITQFLILATLNEVRQAAVNELAERLDTERTAMGKMVGVLEQDGLVRIRPSPTDGRMRIVELTKEGESLHERASPLWRAAQRQFARLNGTGAVAMLRQGLSDVKADLATVKPSSR
jgi:DNA-binding MarR family transcriptional regulator